MPENEKKGITVKIDAQLHAQVKEFVEANGMTMAEFVSKALDDELHPIMTQEDNNMSNTKSKTLAIQVPEDLFNQIKEYVARHHMTQKEFIIGLISAELERDMALRNSITEEQASPDEQDEEIEDTGLGEDESVDEDIGEDEDEDIVEGESQSLGM